MLELAVVTIATGPVDVVLANVVSGLLLSILRIRGSCSLLAHVRELAAVTKRAGTPQIVLANFASVVSITVVALTTNYTRGGKKLHRKR